MRWLLADLPMLWLVIKDNPMIITLGMVLLALLSLQVQQFVRKTRSQFQEQCRTTLGESITLVKEHIGVCLLRRLELMRISLVWIDCIDGEVMRRVSLEEPSDPWTAIVPGPDRNEDGFLDILLVSTDRIAMHSGQDGSLMQAMSFAGLRPSAVKECRVDFDSDGIDDVCILIVGIVSGGAEVDGKPASALILSGSSFAVIGSVDVDAVDIQMDTPPQVAVLVSDLTGDSFPDLLVGSEKWGHRGGVAAIDIVESALLWRYAPTPQPSDDLALIGTELTLLPDCDGDGVVDVLVAGADQGGETVEGLPLKPNLAALSGSSGQSIWKKAVERPYSFFGRRAYECEVEGVTVLAVPEFRWVHRVGQLNLFSTKTGKLLSQLHWDLPVGTSVARIDSGRARWLVGGGAWFGSSQPYSEGVIMACNADGEPLWQVTGRMVIDRFPD